MWIETHQSLANHPKLKRLARKLGVTKQEAMGYLIMMWLWAMSYAPEGDVIPRNTPEDIADATEYNGNAQDLVEAFIYAGFLDKGNDVITIHDWHDYVGRLIEKREKDKERKRQAREKERQAKNATRNC